MCERGREIERREIEKEREVGRERCERRKEREGDAPNV